MRYLKRTAAWLLALALLQAFGSAAAEDAVPTIPVFQGKLDVRPAASEKEAVAYAKEIWALDYLGMDFDIAFYEAEPDGEGGWRVYAKDGADDGDYCFGDVVFDRRGNVLRVENAASGVYEVLNEDFAAEADENTQGAAPPEDDATVAWRDTLDRTLMYPFLEAVCPEVYREYIQANPVREGTSSEFLAHYDSTHVDSYNKANVFDLYYSESYHGAALRIRIAVQTSPVIRIVDFDVHTDASEGGNG